ncbi:FAD-binding oxidoreductase [Limibaculum sp. M0105]|uniref:FAD-binding oxidoreductase n=1 Tax=Thermohalobaculum xanthum TaxID=2753746 RepID=A0A8J7SJQ2_9RHOB|nr:FAD-binding oxidoreductase [Thermohalobaculum xanthum]MBK0401120.1 FAD-binding oxidoreductase [Thermohalobaculum xanthum]
MSAWADGMRETPFWHEAAPPEPASGSDAPDEVDVAVVGAGYTGLSCALALASAGRRVVVFEAGAPGAGASTRNGGMIGWGHRAKIETLAKSYGREAAVEMLSEARNSLDFTLAMIEHLPGKAMYRRTGRFLGAGSARHFDALARWAEAEAPVLGMEVEVVPRAVQGRHIATDLYHGGLYLPQHGGLHPALFHAGLLASAREAGAVVVDHCPVTAIAGAPGAWRIGHGRGETWASEVVYAGNGYTGGGAGPFPDIARRLVPIPSTIIATEPMGENRVGALFPGGNMIVETRATHGYFRPDPWGERILFGGRASLNVLPERESARRLRDMMLSVFPELGEVRLTHSWKGFVAFTFDGVPHAGQLGGVWHACGYNGSGVAMAPYLGWKIARRILGLEDGATGFDKAEFRAQALYRGNPWFLSVLELWMKLQDRREGVAAIRRRS